MAGGWKDDAADSLVISQSLQTPFCSGRGDWEAWRGCSPVSATLSLQALEPRYSNLALRIPLELVLS